MAPPAAYLDCDVAREVMSPEDGRRARDIAIATLKIIQALTRVGPDKAQDALLTINAIVETLYEGLDGRTTLDIVEAELKALVSPVENDAFSVADQFDNSDP